MTAALRSIVASTRGRLVAWAGVACVLVATALVVYRPPLLVQQDYRVYDAMVRWNRPEPPTERVVIVDVDERSLSDIGQWPWRRDIIGRLIGEIRDAGAAAIALDVLMPEADRFVQPAADDGSQSHRHAVDFDGELTQSLQRGRVVLGYAMTFGEAWERSPACLLHPLPVALVYRIDDREDNPLFHASGAVCNLTQFQQAAQTSGFLNAVPDADGVLRRVPLLMAYQGRLYPGFALAAVTTAAAARATAVLVHNAASMSLMLGDRSVPLDGRGNLLLNFRGGKRTFRYISATDVLAGRQPAGSFRDKLVLVGATALGAQDVTTTPLDTLVPGVEVQATVADNLLGDDFLSRPDYGLLLETVTGLGLALLVLIAGVRYGLAWGLASAAFCLVVVWAAVALVFAGQGLYVSPLFPTLGIAASLGPVAVSCACRQRSHAARLASDLSRSQNLVVQSLLSLAEVRDADTGRHSRRIQTYAKMLGAELSSHPQFHGYLTTERIDLMATLAPLHDIGKVGVPDRVLHKTGTLTPDEYAEIKKHPVYGRDVITRAQEQVGVSDDPILVMAKDIVYTHHEWWDGSGYPQGLRAEQIPVAGRVVALVDFYDALVTKRVYREPLPFRQTLDLIVEGKGTHFDPVIVDAFLHIAPLFEHALASDSLDSGALSS